jgi:penicillin-binding protein 1A
MLGAYAVLANGGFRVQPYLIGKVTDNNGKVLMEAQPRPAGDESIRAIDPRNAYVMHSLLNEVTRSGTGARAGAALKRGDLGGKTGTTNDSHDAWFAGYGGNVVAVGWMGFDQPKPLGERETGGGLVLPIWIGYMGKALAGQPEVQRAMPEGVVVVGDELYYAEHQPGHGVASVGLEDALPADEKAKRDTVRDQIF